MADLTLEIEIFIRIMSRSLLLSCKEISMERSYHGEIMWWRDDVERAYLAI